VEVEEFWVDERPVTVADSGSVKGTGYVTVAERPLDPADFPGAAPKALVPGSRVFHPRAGRSTCATFATGGPMCLRRAGIAPQARERRRTRAIP
jgi:hypothetical protein